ncbi:osmotically-inducible protein OsmY [Pseudidiomarina aestuarii]|uniref:Osmotically-inducible protein OsmY n=1 Tax=Pseudidiomarina aestuarii TaxID=624146 RepID=A0A6N4DJ88_9GAMM|nr:osmotically-inducible protein OsmY [Pseudidiomarina aestuarii]
MNILQRTTLVAVLTLSLSGCAAALVGATAVGIASASDSRTVGAQVDDQAIEVKAITALKREDKLDAARIQVVSFNRSILLMGQVANRNLSDLAANTVRSIDGVIRVHNEIRVGDVIGLKTISNDTWITSRVKAQLLANKEVEGSRVKVVTENGEVFLMGIVSRAEAQTAIDIARNVNGVTRVIDAFEVR